MHFKKIKYFVSLIIAIYLQVGNSWAQVEADSVISDPIIINDAAPDITLPDTVNNTENTPPVENPSLPDTVSDITITPPVPLENLKDTIHVYFTKYKSEISENDWFFNVLVIKNYYSVPVSGEMQIIAPDAWNVISIPQQTITIQPDDSVLIPVRVAIPDGIRGGVAFPVSAKFTANDGKKYMNNFYLLKQIIDDFDLIIPKSIIYLNSVLLNGELKMKLVNRGNIQQLIRVELKMGKLVAVQGMKKDSDYIYIEIPPNKDTTITLPVWYKPAAPDEKHLESRMDESTVKVIAYSLEKKKSASVWYKYVPNIFYNTQGKLASPLNMGLYFNNLLDQSPMNVRYDVFGSLFFKNNTDLSYYASIFNITPSTPSFQNVDGRTFFARYFRFYTTYSFGNTVITLGSRISGAAVPIMGTGISVNHKFSRTRRIKGTFAQNLFSDSYGGGVSYTDKIGNFPSFTIAGGAMRNNGADLNIRRFSFNSHIPIKVINLSYGFVYNNTIAGPNNFLGAYTFNSLGYSIGSSYRYNKFSIRAAYNNRANIYANSAHTSNGNINSSYIINTSSRFDLLYNIRTLESGLSNDLSKPFSGFDYHFARVLFTHRFESGTGIQVGPVFQYNSRTNNYNTINKFQTNAGHSERMSFVFNKRITSKQMLSPYVNAGYSFFSQRENYYAVDSIVTISSKPLFNYNLGITYNSGNVFRLNVNYFYGPYFFYSQIDAISNTVLYKSIRVTPSYQKTYYKPNYSVRLGSFSNYIFTMPSNSERLTLNFTVDYMFNNGWSFGLWANAFFNNRVDNEHGKVSNRNYNLNLSVRKSFDFQQPRTKFFNLKMICFKDINGNGSREENEPLLNNILIIVSKANQELKPDLTFTQAELLTNYDGEVKYIKIPEGDYSLDISALVNLIDLLPLNGNKQEISIGGENLTYYIPFVQSYKVNGHIILVRDEFSSLGTVDVSNIRITAIAEDGRSFSTLTDKIGEYLLSIPQAGIYKIKVNNVFGENFEIENDELMLDFNGMKSFELDFKFVEKKRKVNFNGTGLHKFGFEDGRTGQPIPSKDSLGIDKDAKRPNQQPNSNNKSKESELNDAGSQNNTNDSKSEPVDKSQVKFKVQIGVYAKATEEQVNKIKAIEGIEQSKTEEGLQRFTSKPFNSFEDASLYRQEIIKTGIDTTFIIIVGDYKGRILTASEAQILLQE